MPTLKEFEDNCDRLLVKPYDDKVGQLVHATMGVAGESGELVDAVKKHWIYGKELDRHNVREECGDLLFYIAKILRLTGWTMQQAIDHNMEKLNARYPVGYTDQHAIDRLDKQEN